MAKDRISMYCLHCYKHKLEGLREKTVYNEMELMCQKNKDEHYYFQNFLEKINSGPANCMRNCGFRGPPKKLKEHVCREITPRYLCLICWMYHKNALFLYTAFELLNHVYQDHKYNLIILENCPGYTFKFNVDIKIALLVKYNVDYVQNELYWLQILNHNTKMGIRYLCSFKGINEINTMSFERYSIGTDKQTTMLLNRNVLSDRSPDIFPKNENVLNISSLHNDNIIVEMQTATCKKLPQEVLMELDCVICTDILSSPIRMCDRGHSFCEICFKKINRCPNCQARLSQARNFALEKIVNQIDKKCKYNVVGCKERPKMENIENHQEKCWFRPYLCFHCRKSMCYKDIVRDSCIQMKYLDKEYVIEAKDHGYEANSPVKFHNFDEVFILLINTVNSEIVDDIEAAKMVQYKNSTYGGLYKVIDNLNLVCSPCDRRTVEDDLIYFSVENITKMRDIKYYYELTVTDKTDKKVMMFSAECDPKNSVGIPKGYFKSGHNLTYVLKIYYEEV